MSRLRSFITLFWIATYSLAMPLADGDDDSDDDDDDGCWSNSDMVVSTRVSDSPSAALLAPYEHPQTPHPSPSQYPHATLPATLPVSHRSQILAILGAVFGILLAIAAFFFTARYVIRRRRLGGDPFKDPPKSRFTVFRLPRSTASKKRLSDESWVSPTLPALGSPVSPLSQDLELSRYAYPRCKLVPVTTPVCTPTDTEFGSRLGFANGDLNSTSGSVVHVPPVRVPSPVYIPPFSPTPTPSLSSSPSSLSPTPSTERLTSPSPNPARLSRLLSSTFRDTRVVEPPARPTTAHLIHNARSYAYAYRPSSATSTSLYTPPTRAGARSRTSFYPGPTVRDTFSTVTTSDTETVCTVPHLLRAIAEDPSPFADPDPGNEQPSVSTRSLTRTPMGTLLGLKLRLSDASEHAHYRLRERERQQAREQRLSTDSCESTATVRAVHERVRSVEGGKEFRLRDSESVLREIGW